VAKKSTNAAAISALKRELKNAEAKVKAVLQAEGKFRPMLKKATPVERAKVKLNIKSLKKLYKRMKNLVPF
jgi:cytochrome c556